jgi:UDP-N-acetylglucosamine transferase subunit ALG13
MSSPARRAPWRHYLAYPEMEAALREASAVVSHGGPGTIMLALAAGKKPIVVPRRSALGEHVDDHQVNFARRASDRGTIWLAESIGRFRELLDTAAAHPEQFMSNPPELGRAVAFRKVEQLVDDLIRKRSA